MGVFIVEDLSYVLRMYLKEKEFGWGLANCRSYPVKVSA